MRALVRGGYGKKLPSETGARPRGLGHEVEGAGGMRGTLRAAFLRARGFLGESATPSSPGNPMAHPSRGSS
jgi:hypothetical protein